MAQPQVPEDHFRDVQAMDRRIEALERALRPGFQSGDMKATARRDLEAGWLHCDGASYLRSDFPDLFAGLGGTASPWGLPDATHFKVPDMRDRGAVGAGTGVLTTRKLGDYFGTEPSNMPNHSHGGVTGGMNANNPHSHPYYTGGGPTFDPYLTAGAGGTWVDSGAVGARDINHGHSITAEGSGSGTDGNVPPSTAVNWLVKI